MLYLKTATLIEAAAKASALLVGKDAEKHALYGRNLGLSFQIIDDILDITATEEALGKPAMNDYVEGKCTLPYIYLYEALNTDDRERLVASHTKKISKDETLWIQEKMQEHTSIEKSFQIAQILSNEAQNAMSEDKELVSILESMIKRTF
jgi:octaprenyl-diphosphate synthase